MIPKELLKEEISKLGLECSSEQLEMFDAFAQMLVQGNKRLNLTAITEPKDIALKHFLDSISVLKYVHFEPGERVADVGTGAGFPAIPLLIMRPDLKITMLDGTKKRLDFIDDSLKELGLSGVTAHMRAEDAGRDAKYRETFDKAVSRAVANMNTLCEYCLPLVKVGGLFIAMKGRSAAQELNGALGAVKTLCGEVIAENRFFLPGEEERNIIAVKKISHLPTKYPRSFAKISKSPLE